MTGRVDSQVGSDTSKNGGQALSHRSEARQRVVTWNKNSQKKVTKNEDETVGGRKMGSGGCSSTTTRNQ